MESKRSRKAALEFLDYIAQKGLMTPNTAQARKAAVGKVLGVLSEDESQDVISVDLDAIMSRFQNLYGKTYTPESLNTYKSRVRSALDDFASYVENPLAWRPRKSAAASGPRSGKLLESRKVETEIRASPVMTPTSGPMASSILPIPIRADLTVMIQGLPYDLTTAEAKKIAGVVQAMAVGD
jgi:hypothetical protein